MRNSAESSSLLIYSLLTLGTMIYSQKREEFTVKKKVLFLQTLFLQMKLTAPQPRFRALYLKQSARKNKLLSVKILINWKSRSWCLLPKILSNRKVHIPYPKLKLTGLL